MKKSILLILLSCLTIAGIFLACEKAYRINDNTVVDVKSGEFDKWNPDDKFKLTVINQYRKMVISGKSDLNGVVKFELFENNIRVLNSTVVINGESFAPAKIVDKYENIMKVEIGDNEIGDKVSILNVKDMISYTDMLEFNMMADRVIKTEINVKLRVIGTSFAPINSM